MPSKLRFKVCYCAGEDPDYPANELNIHSPHTKGWQSARFCEYPQEIGLQFAGSVQLNQIQILSHQSKIATRIELFCGSIADSDQRPSYAKAKFKRLGYVSLDSNERSNFQARELKTVQFNAVGTFMKLLIHKCHVNRLNIYSQVGLIAVNVIGDPSPPALKAAGMQVSAISQPNAKNISPLDDLTFDLNFDPTTAKHIRELHAAKDRAVAAEDYDAAKRLKDAIDQLKEVGGRIAKLELRKKSAVQNEDYDTAKLIKVEIDKLRHGLAAGTHAPPSQTVVGGPVPGYDEPASSRRETKKSSRPNTKDPFARAKFGSGAPPGMPAIPAELSPQQMMESHDSPAAASYHSPVQAQAMASVHGSPLQPASVAGGASVRASLDEDFIRAEQAVPYVHDPDDRPIPTLVKGSGGPPTLEELDENSVPGAQTGGGGQGEEPEELSAANANDAAALIDVFGERPVKCLYSKVWGLRDEALNTMLEQLPNLSVEKANIHKALLQVIRRGLDDKIPQVFYMALRMLAGFVDAASNVLKANELHHSLEPILTTLVKKLADSNMRTNKDTTETLLGLAHHKGCGCPLVAHALVKPIKNQGPWRPVLSRLQIMHTLITQYGISPESGFAVDAVMNFCLAAFNSANGSVRTVAAKVVALVEKNVGADRLQKYLKAVKPQILDMINAECAAQAEAGEAN